MSGRGGVYEVDGHQLHGDGREVEHADLVQEQAAEIAALRESKLELIEVLRDSVASMEDGLETQGDLEAEYSISDRKMIAKAKAILAKHGGAS